MFKVFILLFLSFLRLASAQEITPAPAMDYEAIGGSPATKQVILADGSQAWLHGCYIGATLTINGVPAGQGSYQLKNSSQALNVNAEGKIIEFPHSICKNKD